MAALPTEHGDKIHELLEALGEQVAGLVPTVENIGLVIETLESLRGIAIMAGLYDDGSKLPLDLEVGDPIYSPHTGQVVKVTSAPFPTRNHALVAFAGPDELDEFMFVNRCTPVPIAAEGVVA